MDGKAIVASTVVGILGLISTIVGLAFELLPYKAQARLYYVVQDRDECLYFQSPAFFMVVAAIVCVVVALIIISISADCGCGRGTSSSSCSRGLAILAFVCCWLKCVTAIILFLYGGVSQYGLRLSKDGGSISLDDVSQWINPDNRSCFFRMNRGLFGAAAALTFIGIALGITSYIALVSGDYRIRRARQDRRETIHELQQRPSQSNIGVPSEIEA